MRITPKVRSAVLAIAAVLLVGAWWWSRPSHPAMDGELAAAALAAPEQTPAGLARQHADSTTAVGVLRASGVTETDPYIRQRLEQVVVSDADARAFYEANRALFGQRNFGQSRQSVDRLLRIHLVQRELGLPSETAGVAYPIAGG